VKRAAKALVIAAAVAGGATGGAGIAIGVITSGTVGPAGVVCFDEDPVSGPKFCGTAGEAKERQYEMGREIGVMLGDPNYGVDDMTRDWICMARAVNVGYELPDRDEYVRGCEAGIKEAEAGDGDG
jgi:hypothetical protein